MNTAALLVIYLLYATVQAILVALCVEPELKAWHVALFFMLAPLVALAVFCAVLAIGTRWVFTGEVE